MSCLFPKGFAERADRNSQQLSFRDLIEKDEPFAAEFEAKQLAILKSGGVDGSIDLSTKSFEQYVMDLERRVNEREKKEE